MKSYIFLVALGLMSSLAAQAEPSPAAYKSQFENKFLTAFWRDAAVGQTIVDAFTDAAAARLPSEVDKATSGAVKDLGRLRPQNPSITQP
jgi:hypothetical protein